MKRKSQTPHNIKHKHGTPNPIMLHEEEVMLATVDKVLASTTNPQTIGRNGEIPLRDFLNRHLPYTFRAVTGHFVTPNGLLSPQIDVMILDTRYPFLAENADGSVLAMLHSLITTIEVKTRLTTRDIEKLWSDSIKIMKLAAEVEPYGNFGEWGSISTQVFAYRSAQSLDALETKYVQLCQPQSSMLDIQILRLPHRDLPQTIGFELHFEPVVEDNILVEYVPMAIPFYNILSDLYYRLIQNSYYSLQTRDYSYGDIGQHIMSYMSWSTYLGDRK